MAIYKDNFQKNGNRLYSKAIFRKIANGFIQRKSLGKWQMAIDKDNPLENGK